MSGTVTRSRLRDFLRDDGGATAIEYALIASGIAGAIIAAVIALGTSVTGMYTSISNGFN